MSERRVERGTHACFAIDEMEDLRRKATECCRTGPISRSTDLNRGVITKHGVSLSLVGIGIARLACSFDSSTIFSTLPEGGFNDKQKAISAKCNLAFSECASELLSTDISRPVLEFP